VAGNPVAAAPGTRRVAVVNAGASTLKLAMVQVAQGRVRQIDRMQHDWGAAATREALLRDALASLHPVPQAIGHRVVHGGSRFVTATRLTEVVENELAALVPLAPLHNEPAVAAMRAARILYPSVPGVAVFDTAFHADRPTVSKRYALPAALVDAYDIRRHGFHGLAHASLVAGLAAATGKPAAEVSAVTLQLGAGCSACAVRNGQSIETSMGFTPLEGLVMATRSGDIDPAVVLRLMRAGHSADEIETQLTRQAGWFGLCGLTDMRDVVAAADAGQADAQSALDLFCHRVALTVGAYLTLLDGDGAVVFGGGIGSHSAAVRVRVGEKLSAWDVVIDADRNGRPAPGRISPDGARPVYALLTDEESIIACETDRRLDWPGRGGE
jgi:acetate kinase